MTEIKFGRAGMAMETLKQVEELQGRVAKLCALYKQIRPTLEELESATRQGMPVAQSLGSTIQRMLAQILDEQEVAVACCADLKFDTPETWPALAEKLETHAAGLAERARYQDAVDFFLSLRSTAPEIQEILQDYQENLRNEMCRQPSAEAHDHDLERYARFQEAYWEQDPQKKFNYAKQISEKFDLQLAFGMNSGVITVGEQTITASSAEGKTLPKEELPQEGSSSEMLPAECPASEENKWETLGIDDPTTLIVALPVGSVHIRQGNAEKPFGVKSFKHELERYDRREKTAVLRLVNKFWGCITPALTAALLGLKEDAVRSACERLVDGGYLVWHELAGIGDVYGMSAKGEMIFTSKESAQLLGVPRQRRDPDRTFWDESGYTVLQHWQVQRLFTLLQRNGLPHANDGSLGPGGFFQRFPQLGAREVNVGYLGCTARTPEEFERLLSLVEGNEPLDLLIVSSIDLDHARATAGWIKDRCASTLKDTTVWTMDCASCACFTEVGEEMDLMVFLGEASQSDSDPEAEADADANAGFVLELDDETGPEPAEEAGLQAKAEVETEDQAKPEPEAAPEPKTQPESKAAPKAEPAQDGNMPEGSRSVSALTGERRAQYQETMLDMLAGGKTYCATAWLHALSLEYPEYRRPWIQLAYALNDPAAECEYSSNRLFQVYYSDDAVSPDAFVAAATLRNCFLNQCGYDYQLDQLWDAVAKFPLLERNVSLKQVLNRLKEFKSKYHRGIDAYADYRQKKRGDFEQAMAVIQADAQSIYQKNVGSRLKENKSQKRFLETKKLIFAPHGDLAECLDAVQHDNREMLEVLEDLLRTQYIKDGEPISADTIDGSKIDQVLNDAWEKAGNSLCLVKHSSDLLGSLRTNLHKQLQRTVAILCRYVSTILANKVDENDPGLVAYRRVRSPLLQDIQDAVDFLAGHPGETLEDRAGQAVLLNALYELRQRLDGSFEDNASQYYYLPFLQGDEMLLDEDYLPVLTNVQEVDELSALTRIQRHAAARERPLEERLREIQESQDEWGGDYGSARLILSYLKAHPQQVQDKELLELDPEQDIGFADPGAFLESKRRAFGEYLELAQSYGQIDNTEGEQKETMLQIMNDWFDWTQETHNFSFCKKVFAALCSKIEKDATVRAQDLTASLAVYQKKNQDWEKTEELRNAIQEIQERIRVQNYTAAEDLLNRLNANDLDTELSVTHADYLEEFLREYAVNAGRTGKPGSSLPTNYLPRELNKDTKGARRLLESWPKGSGTSSSKIRELLEGLGFPVKDVFSENPIHGKDHYQILLSQGQDGQRSGYKHPVSVFGSEAATRGFRVVNIFGKMDAGRLIDTFQELGDTKNTLILLDYALTLPDRQELARRTKVEFRGKTFAVIDRVALVYLASHYSETAVNRMLMSVIMPFAACRLYQPNSSQDMPPELFIGRKDELEKIKSPNGVNIVYGGRQLGKTALLRKAQKDVNHDENGDRAVWIDIKFKDYREAAKKISGILYDEGILKIEHITEDWDELARDIKNRLRDTKDPIPYLLLLIDEADTFIESCGAVKYQPIDALKDIQGVGGGRFKFVVAGLHNVVRFKRDLAISDNIGLTHLGYLTVTPFKYREARELLEVPLSYLGFRFPDNEETARLVSTIFTTTNYFPGLLQLYCSKLIEALQRNYAGYSESEVPPYVVKEDLIKKVLNDESLLQQIQDKFDITIKVDKSQDDYYYLVTLLAAYYSHNACNQEGFGPDDIIGLAADYEIRKLAELPRESVAALMEEMQELNILKRLGNGRYRFARFNFREMMGSVQAIEDKILEYGEEG